MNKTNDQIVNRLENLSNNDLKIIFKKMYGNSKECPRTKKDIISKLCEPLEHQKRLKYHMKRHRENNMSELPSKKSRYDDTEISSMISNLSIGIIPKINRIPIKFNTNNYYEVPTKENRKTWEHSNCNNDYQFKQILGKGSDGWVYKAIKNKRTVAIKVINLSSNESINTNTNKKFYVTKKQILNEFRNEIKMGLLGHHYGISPKIYDYWICRYRPKVKIKKLPDNSKPNSQSLLDYKLCSDRYPKFDPFGNGCRNVDTGFVVMETLPITLYNYIKEKTVKKEFIKIAYQLGNMINIIEKSILYLGIVAYDAHLNNWMLNNGGKLYMTDFGRISHIKDVYNDIIKSVKIGSKIVIFSDMDSDHDDTLKYGTVIKNIGNYWKIKTVDGTIVNILKTNVFPSKQFQDKMLPILKNIITESVCNEIVIGKIPTNPVNPILILCKVFKNFNLTLQNIINIRDLLLNWDKGLNYNTVIKNI